MTVEEMYEQAISISPVWTRASGEYKLTGYVAYTPSGWYIQRVEGGNWCEKMTGKRMYSVWFEVGEHAFCLHFHAESKIQAYFFALECLNKSSDHQYVEFPEGVIIEEKGWSEPLKSGKPSCEWMPKTLSEL
jgi:hypothetical protein